VDPKQNPDKVCDVRKGVLKLIESPDIKITNVIFPKTMWYRYRGNIPRIT
jgi:hypothetical protein